MGIPIVEIVVIKVVQRIYVRDPRIRDVHVAEIISAGVIPRTERFAESQREPADSTAPTAAYKRPASIVKWRKAPWLIIHPGPAPRANPVPVSITIRGPANCNRAGIPNRAIVRLFSP